MKIKFTLILALTFLVCGLGFAQKKQMWAKSYLNQKAPSIDSIKWITDQPDTKGKFVLLDFWATWCKPCKNVIPHMNAFSTEFKNDIIVIGISEETEEKVKSMKTPVMEYFSALDANSSLNTAYSIQGIPHVVLIDPKGVVRWEGFPALTDHELTSEVIKDIIDKYDQ
ncbi:MAG: TlpA disulfide reductase family protein [Psychroserpens sp.]|uniref:TlpA family protein disulfide reductase n=1 Tax=Psychroserpens sp. TaxID=2020870 RepID=UPI0030035E99